MYVPVKKVESQWESQLQSQFPVVLMPSDGCCRLYWWIERCSKFYILQWEKQLMHISASSGSILLFLVSKCLLLWEYLACSWMEMWISKIKKVWFWLVSFEYSVEQGAALHVQLQNKLGGGYLTMKSYQSVSWPMDIVALHFSHSGHLG